MLATAIFGGFRFCPIFQFGAQRQPSLRRYFGEVAPVSSDPGAVATEWPDLLQDSSGSVSHPIATALYSNFLLTVQF